HIGRCRALSLRPVYTSASFSTLLLLLFFTRPPTTQIYTLSLHDALPIYNRFYGVFSLGTDHYNYEVGSEGNPVNAYALSYSIGQDRKSTRLNSSHVKISYAVFCLKKKKLAAGRRLLKAELYQLDKHNSIH